MSNEFFDIVDENDNVVGKTSREECHEKGLIHRSVMFFVFDDEERVLVTKRTKNKDFFPGYWSIVLGGHVQAEESYEEAVLRETIEETGLNPKPFFITSFKKRIPEEKENVKVYGIVAREEDMEDIILNKEELEEGEFLDLVDLEKKINTDNFLPETEILYDILKKYLS
ncbi:MAG: NUDIX domain-containing protein [Thermoplasmata archaeon]|nr:MAG: NUDIX domain-containing protein [Thermoplasmata archaeon]